MGLVVKDDGWRIDDKLWERMEPLLPPRKPHPLGCHNPRVPDRDAMNAILLVLRTGCQWNALNATGICSSSSAYRRFREWTDAGVFERLWREGLAYYDAPGRIEERAVQIGARNRLNGEALEGLREGEALATAIRREKASERLRW